MTTEKRAIDQGTYLQALALFTMSANRLSESVAYEAELTKILGLEDNGHVSDAIYAGEGGTLEKRLNEALDREGISIPAQVDERAER